MQIIEALAGVRQSPVQILTHCNAGALETLGWGTATAPIYLAHAAGVSLHVWVSETRPRLQGARLTAWELHAHGVPHTLVVDAAGAALMRQHRVDLVLVGADRVTRNGDVCKDIRCAAYATFGTQQLSDHALCALEGRKACLLANHGMIAVGASLTAALALAVEVEALAEQYWRALQIGAPNLLSDAEMEIVLEKFRTYGQPDAKR